MVSVIHFGCTKSIDETREKLIGKSEAEVIACLGNPANVQVYKWTAHGLPEEEYNSIMKKRVYKVLFYSGFYVGLNKHGSVIIVDAKKPWPE